MIGSQMLSGIGPAAGGGGYTGPLDLTATPAVVAYGQRALSAAKLGTAVYAITRTSDSAAQTFNSDAVTGDVPVSTIQSFIGGGRGYVGIAADSTPAWIDQSASGADLNGSTGFPLRWNVVPASVRPGCGGAAPTDDSPGNDIASGGPVGWSASSPLSMFYVAYLDVADTDGDDLFFVTANVGFSYFEIIGSADDLRFVIGDNSHNQTTWSLPAADRSGLHIFEVLCDATGNVTFLMDGGDQGATIASGSLQPTSAFAANPYIGVPANASFTGSSSYAYEGLLFAAILSSSDRTAIRQNIAAWYGIAL